MDRKTGGDPDWIKKFKAIDMQKWMKNCGVQ